MAAKTANGLPPGMASPRPPFRRQGSSIAGGQHPMTVALTPAQRVDYSVTKGGARTWAVLLVFMFLCSSLYTVFSAKEVAEMGIDFDGDGDMDLDADLDDDVDEVATQQKHALKDTTPTKEEHRGHDRKNEKQSPQEEVKTADDDDAYVETTLEEKLFAGLRAKMQKLSRLVKDKQNERAEEEEQEEEEQPIPQRKERGRRRKKRTEEKEESEEEEKPKKSRRSKKQQKRVAEEDEEDKEEEEDTETEEKKIPKKKAQLRWNPKKKREEIIIDGSEDHDADDDEDDDEKGKGIKDGRKTEEQEDKDDEEEEEMDTDEKADDKEDEDAEEDKDALETAADSKAEDEEEKGDEEADEEKKEVDSKEKKPRDVWPVRKSPKRVKTAHITDAAPARECRRKHCPTDFGIEPRMALLKKNKVSQTQKRYEVYKDELDDEDEDEEEEDEGNEESEEVEEEEEEDEEKAQADYAEVVAIKKYRSTGREAYKRHAITNRDDHKHRETLDHGDYLVEKHHYGEAIQQFDQVLKSNPDSPRAHFGKARAYDIRAEFESEDSYVDMALAEYEEVLDNDDTPDALFRQAASRVIERSRYRGNMHRALNAQRTLIDRFPDEKNLQTDFGLTFLMMKRHDDARKVFKNILDSDPSNALALAYYGYILKVEDGDVESGVHLMRKGLMRGGDELTDPKFYYHLGDGLMQLGRPTEAYKVYEHGADLGLFLSAHQRSMYNVEGLTARPWWSVEQTTYTKYLRMVERQWVSIRHEALAVLDQYPDELDSENEAITVDGEWKALRLLHNEEWDEENCELMPQTCAILREFREASNASRSEMKISVLSSGTRVLPHCGPTNCRLQAHLGLVVPSEARIRVGADRRGWKTGRFVVFDDSFEHELSFDGASSSAFRLVLAIDLWHPEMDVRQRADLFDED